MRKLNIFFLLTLSVLISACSSPTVTTYAPQPINTTNLTQLQELRQVKVTKNKNQPGHIRLQALKESGMTVGAQGALALRSKQIDKMLDHNVNYLNKIFDFNGLMLSKQIVPPVLQESHNSLSLSEGDNAIRIADRTYKILEQAHFTTTTPTWREYLYLNFKKPAVPDVTLLPKTVEEQKAWRRYVQEGWDNGITQANTIFAENIARLKRDYVGMALYKKLVDENMISQPIVAGANLGITGDGNQLSVNDQFMRITAKPSLNTNSRTWSPAVAHPTTRP